MAIRPKCTFNTQKKFDIQRIMHGDIFYNRTNKIHYFTNLFWYRTLHVSDRFTVHHQESSIAYTAIDIYHTGYAYADCLLVSLGWSSILITLADSQKNLYDKYLLLRIQY
jgi:hypothetical protein